MIEGDSQVVHRLHTADVAITIGTYTGMGKVYRIGNVCSFIWAQLSSTAITTNTTNLVTIGTVPVGYGTLPGGVIMNTENPSFYNMNSTMIGIDSVADPDTRKITIRQTTTAASAWRKYTAVWLTNDPYPE